jgi:DNA-3-methyladenine glycosylase
VSHGPVSTKARAAGGPQVDDAARAAPRSATVIGPPPSRQSLADDPLDVAPRLLGMVLVHGRRAGRIVEVEAYRGAHDPASHAFRGRTARNATMFGPAGFLYVYFTYGMHFCANVVCGPEGEAGAVLVRALEPVRGLEAMRAARAAGRRDGSPPPDRDLCRGPANLTSALGVDGSFDGCDLLGVGGKANRCPSLRTGVAVPADAVAEGPRIGITRAAELPWRFWVAANPFVSGSTALRARSPG